MGEIENGIGKVRNPDGNLVNFYKTNSIDIIDSPVSRINLSYKTYMDIDRTRFLIVGSDSNTWKLNIYTDKHTMISTQIPSDFTGRVSETVLFLNSNSKIGIASLKYVSSSYPSIVNVCIAIFDIPKMEWIVLEPLQVTSSSNPTQDGADIIYGLPFISEISEDTLFSEFFVYVRVGSSSQMEKITVDLNADSASISKIYPTSLENYNHYSQFGVDILFKNCHYLMSSQHVYIINEENIIHKQINNSYIFRYYLYKNGKIYLTFESTSSNTTGYFGFIDVANINLNDSNKIQPHQLKYFPAGYIAATILYDGESLVECVYMSGTTSSEYYSFVFDISSDTLVDDSKKLLFGTYLYDGYNLKSVNNTGFLFAWGTRHIQLTTQKIKQDIFLFGATYYLQIAKSVLQSAYTGLIPKEEI